MSQFQTDIWRVFEDIGERCTPKRVDILTGVIGAGAHRIIWKLKVKPRLTR